jgi:hypothetical protein
VHLTAGSKLGSYEILAPLGAGGMGEVYRARDGKLGRDVALKVLPASFVEDKERLARFQREAQILAALNHPNIAAIHGLEQSDATPFLVLELVEGETLDARLKAHAGLPVNEALTIARQIAEALEAAHDKGIIHRDLKPANIVVDPDGVVKVLDFGLAKAMEPAATGEQSQSPTITFAATQAGVILGTAAYMSPEQAKGRVADKRTDVWAFGCVLFEMLTGRRAFEGEDVTDTIAAIVRGEPAWHALPDDVPEQIRLLIRRCLEKDRRARVPDIGVARFLMTETIAAAPAGAHVVTSVDQPRRSSWLHVAFAGTGGLIAGAGLMGIVAWLLLRPPAETSRPTARFSLTPPAAQPLVLQVGDRNVDIARDGTFIVYRGAIQSTPQLFVRPLNSVDARPLGGLAEGNVRTPFISPDGHWIGFFAGQELKKVLSSGGPSISVCHMPGPPRGASWGSDGTIVFATGNPSYGLMAVSANGGEPTTLIKPDSADIIFGQPFVLPGSTAVLFSISTPGAAPEVDRAAQVAVLDRRTGQWKSVVRGGGQPQYVGGYLVYGVGGILRAVRFDLERLAPIGDPIPMLDQVLSGTASVNFAVSQEGSLVYVPTEAGTVSVTPRSLVWVTRDGHEEPFKLPAHPYEGVRLSPDGTRLAVGIRDAQKDVWIGDIGRPPLTRLTFDPTTDQAPIWTSDGKRIVWSSQRGNGTPNVFMQSADGTGVAQQLSSSTQPTFPTSISPDGTKIVVWVNNPVTRQDISLIDISEAAGKQPVVRPLVHSPAVEVGGEISPDGRWLAYESDESGRGEVYVRPFPDVDVGRWQVSAEGGTRPVWARSGRELFYLDANGFLTSVPIVATGSTFARGNPSKVLATKYYAGFTELGLDLRGYDVSPDGKRFLMLKDSPAESTAPTPTPSMIVVLNWLEELKTRINAK